MVLIKQKTTYYLGELKPTKTIQKNDLYNSISAILKLGYADFSFLLTVSF